MAINEVKKIKSKKLYSYDTILKQRNTKNNTNNNGGGVAIFIKSNLNYEQIYLPPEYNELEALVIELKDVKLNSQKLIIATYYNPPDKKITTNFLEYIFSLSENVLLLRDLNAHHQFWKGKRNDQNGDTIFNFILDNNHALLNHQDPTPTYQPSHNPEYKAILDLSIASSSLNDKILNFEITDQIHSDHLATKLTIKCNAHPNLKSFTTSTNNPTKTIKILNWEEFDKQLLKNANNYDFEPTITESDIDNAIIKLTSLINESVEASSTTKEITIRLNKFLTLPKYIVILITKKRKLRRTFFRTLDPLDKTEFNHMQERVNHEIKLFKQEKWITFCNEIQNLHVSDTKLWQKLRTLDDTRPPKSFKLPNLYYGESCTNERSITTKIFAKHLANTFKDNEGPDFDELFKKEIDQLAPTLFTKPNDEELKTIQKINAAEVEDVIKNQKKRRCPRPR